MTAVEWLIDKLSNIKAEDVNSTLEVRLICQQAKAMEKQQIIDAYVEGCSDSILDESTDKTRSEDYYNEKYGK